MPGSWRQHVCTALGLMVAGCTSDGGSPAVPALGADAAAAPDGGADAAGPLPDVGPEPEEVPDPGARSPFPVGLVTLDLWDESRPDPATGEGRWLRTDVWYPATSEAAGRVTRLDLEAEAAGIDLGDKDDVIRNADLPPIEIECVRDAELDGEHGPYPLVLFSHGANGIRWQSVFYTIHLASHGYVVASADHDHNTIWDVIREGFYAESIATSLARRPDDVRFLLDTLLEENDDPDSRFHGALDPDRVAVTGHSLGAVTSAALGCMDDRFKAVVLHSPQLQAGLLVGGCSGPYPVPSLTMGGTLDDTLAWCGQYCGYRDLLGAEQPRYLYELVDGGHFTFSDICLLDLARVAAELELGDQATHILTDGCGEDNVPYEKAHVTINHYATAFLGAYLRGETAWLAHLTERVDPPFDVVRFHEGDVPDLEAEGGCGACSMF